MKKTILLATSAAAMVGMALVSMSAGAAQLSGAAQSYSGDRLEIENFVGRIEIRTGSSDSISVAMTNAGGHVADPSVSDSGSTVRIDGGLSLRRTNCNTRNDTMTIGLNGGRRHNIDEYPSLVITAPASLALELSDSAFIGSAGDMRTVDINMSSCGRFDLGDIDEDARIRISGSGDITAGTIGGDTAISINGSGDITTRAIARNADVSINGSGDVVTGDVGGDADVNINGSGDVEFGRVAGLSVGVSGSGDVEAASMDGAFHSRISGSGDIAVHGGRAQPFEASISGSGDIAFGGTAVDVVVRENGGGDVSISEIEGSVNWTRNGRTVLRVGDVH
ncbi:GIN domain-containing protein [Maricaulis maris]|uniref:GIN domain-containing protein n=1 Tax=Maricaulis maris TaxID=74318 RepID=UPI003B8D4A09